MTTPPDASPDAAAPTASTVGETAPGVRAMERLAATPTSLGHVAVHFRPGERELATWFATGLALFGSVVELDFVFTGPGREHNAFNTLIP